MFFDAILRPGPEFIDVLCGPGHPDDRHVEAAAFDQPLQRREDFLIGEIARRTKENKSIGMRDAHDFLLILQAFPGARRTGNALPTAICPGNRPRRER